MEAYWGSRLGNRVYCGTQNRAVFWPFGKRVTELLILDKKERVAESQ